MTNDKSEQGVIAIYAHDYDGAIDTLKFESWIAVHQWFSKWDYMGYEKMYINLPDHTDADEDGDVDVLNWSNEKLFNWVNSLRSWVTPHKEGRTEMISLRLIPREKRLFDIVSSSKNVTELILNQIESEALNMRMEIARAYDICNDSIYSISELEAGQLQIAHIEDESVSYSLLYDGSEWEASLTDADHIDDYRWRGDDFQQATLNFLAELQRRV